MQKRKQELKMLAGCEGCTKDCKFRNKLASQAGARGKYSCNSSK